MGELLRQYFTFLNRVSVRDRAFMVRQLATMLTSGLPLAQALSIIGLQSSNEVLREALASIVHDLEHGISFSSTIAKHPKVFSSVAVAAVRAGEASGKLDEVLNELALQMEKETETIAKVRGAMIYPIFIIVAMIIATFVVMWKVVPTLTGILTESGQSLPIPTRMLIWLSTSISGFWWIYILGSIAIIYGIRFYIKTDEGRNQWNNLKVKFPVIGPVVQGSYMARFSRTLGMLIGSGVPIIESLKIVSEIIDNDIYRRGILQVADEVSRGVPMSVPLQRNKNFPLIVSQMTLVGEQTGKMDEVFKKLANYYEGQTDETIKGLGSLIEPIILIIIGGAVAFLVFAILMPIYTMSNVIQ